MTSEQTSYVEDIIVKDYGSQGLAIFVPTDSARIGHICGWSTLLVYEPGMRPDMLSCPMDWCEHHSSYFLKGRKPAASDPRVGPFIERYRRWLESLQADGQTVKLRRVLKDQQAYRNLRWQR